MQKMTQEIFILLPTKLLEIKKFRVFFLLLILLKNSAPKFSTSEFFKFFLIEIKINFFF